MEAFSNGWAIDTTAPVDLKKSKDNDVSDPLRSCLCGDSESSLDPCLPFNVCVFLYLVNLFCVHCLHFIINTFEKRMFIALLEK